MTAIYCHIPFCQSQCIYCDFVVVLQKHGGQAAFMQALLHEVDSRLITLSHSDTPPALATSVYFGGGTPSLLPASFFAKVLASINQTIGLHPQAEITMEANPNAILDAPLAYLQAGINRMSIGVQSFQPTELKRLSRNHNAQTAIETVQAFQHAMASHNGQANVSIDLMYGIPSQTQVSWSNTVQQAIGLGVQHVSFYGLKVEDGTPLATLLPYPAYQLPDDDTTVMMYEQAVTGFAQAGFNRYEFSNLAQAGFESQHNKAYWQNQPYLAFGPGAHGYWQGIRTENTPDVAMYCTSPLSGTVTPCPPQQQLENALIFGLRMSEGVNVATLGNAFGINVKNHFASFWTRYAPMLNWQGDAVALKPEYISVSNSMLADLIGVRKATL
jgi:oxygen-independent coproporphyrinogen III oxidase